MSETSHERRNRTIGHVFVFAVCPPRHGRDVSGTVGQRGTARDRACGIRAQCTHTPAAAVVRITASARPCAGVAFCEGLPLLF